MNSNPIKVAMVNKRMMKQYPPTTTTTTNDREETMERRTNQVEENDFKSSSRMRTTKTTNNRHRFCQLIWFLFHWYFYASLVRGMHVENDVLTCFNKLTTNSF